MGSYKHILLSMSRALITVILSPPQPLLFLPSLSPPPASLLPCQVSLLFLYVSVYMYLCMGQCVHMCMCVCENVLCVSVCMHMSVHACVCAHVQSRIHSEREHTNMHVSESGSFHLL